MIAALVMWGVTGSPFALVFAFLGPLVALASLIDDKRGGRKTARAEQARFVRELSSARDLIEHEHAREREQLALLAPSPSDILAGPARSAEWWRETEDSPILVRVGQGTVVSSLELDAPGVPSAGSDDPADESAGLRAATRELRDAPVLVDARVGVVVLGAPVPAAALARAIVAQLAFKLSPATARVTGAEGELFGWLSGLPHRREPGRQAEGRVVFRLSASEGRPSSEIVCAIARHESELPRDCRTVIRVGSAHDLQPLFISESQAMIIAAKAKAGAEAEGLVPSESALPVQLAFSALPPATPTGGLPGVFAAGEDGALSIDLVVDGPHAIIGGTTGSGKSELLISWVLSMAAALGPRELNFLLVDFKGGSSFGGLNRLPHSAGLITDLDQDSAHRALTSLRAELRHRERMLAEAGARSIDDLGDEAPLPRLVIVVDEFAVVVAEFPELQALFADVAARGRSLGVHLILCTQRPAGVVRDSVLANCTLRLSLRVNNRADSAAVIGIGNAGDLPRQPFGRCYLSISGSPPRQMQIALADDDDISAVEQRWASAPTVVRRPWLEPLPEVVLPSMLPAASPPGLPFGLADLPEEQSQPAAVFDPPRQGNLMVVGGHGAGKSGVLAALHESASTQGAYRGIAIPNDVEAAWDQISDALASLHEPSRGSTLYLIDDLDALLARFSEDHQFAFSERLARLLREGPVSGVHTVMTAARLTSAAQALAALCDSRLILRMPNRHEHLLAGGETQTFVSKLPPGGGLWNEHRVQVAFAPVVVEDIPPRPIFEFAPGVGCAVVTARPRAFTARLRAAHPQRGGITELGAQLAEPGQLGLGAADTAPILIADPGAWQVQWSLLAAARGRLPVLFDGCSLSDFRAVSGTRQLPPPLGHRPGAAWVLGIDGTVSRAQLPEWLPGGLS